MYLYLAYITGGLIIALCLLVYVFKSRTISLIFKATIDLTSVINLVFVFLATGNQSIIAGLIATAIGFLRDIVFMFRNKSKYLDHICWPIIFCVFFATSSIVTFKSALTILPGFGSLFSTMTLYSRNMKTQKIGAIICTSLYIIYYAILIPSSDVLTLLTMISSCTSLTGAIVGLVRILINEKKAKEENVETQASN